MTFDEALEIVTAALAPQSLSELQIHILRGAWDQQSYHKIAADLNHEYSYIKDIGAELWQLLSQILHMKVTKLNLQEALVQYIQQPQRPESRIVEWGEAPDSSQFYKREIQLAILEHWMVQDRCRLVAIVGIGGIGKTAIAARFARQFVDQFDVVIWRSLQQAPPILNLLTEIINTIGVKYNTKRVASFSLQPDELIRQLLKQFRAVRCLIIFDQVEAVLSSGELAGSYQSEDYRRLFDYLGQAQHQSSVLLTSREIPANVRTLSGATTPVRLLRLDPCSIEEGEAILTDKGLSVLSQRSQLQTLMEWYQGNPFMLKCVASLICDLYDRDIAAFLAEEALLFNDIRDLIAQQLDRLSLLEWRIMTWLATHQTPQTMIQLQTEFLPSVSRVQLRDALSSLDRRSLIEKILIDTTAQESHGSLSYVQQPVVKEYVLECLNDQTAQETDQVQELASVTSAIAFNENGTIGSPKVLTLPERSSKSMAQI